MVDQRETFTQWCPARWLLIPLLCVFPSPLLVQAQDPTVVSRQLREKLRPQPQADRLHAGDDSNISDWGRDLRLQAIVMRDAGHGTALVTWRTTSTYVVRLTRAAATPPTRIRIGDVSLIVKRFDAKSITFRDAEGNSEVTVRHRELGSDRRQP